MSANSYWCFGFGFSDQFSLRLLDKVPNCESCFDNE